MTGFLSICETYPLTLEDPASILDTRSRNVSLFRSSRPSPCCYGFSSATISSSWLAQSKVPFSNGTMFRDQCTSASISPIQHVLTTTSRELMFALITVPLILLMLSSLDLHQWRQSRLRPKRMVFTASSAFVLLLIILAVLGPCYFRLTLETHYRCPNGLREMWAVWYYYHEKNDLAPTVPFLAAFNMILYVLIYKEL